MKTAVPLLVITTAALGACAGSPPKEELAQARAAVEQVRQPAARYAPDELLSAQRKLTAAETAAREREYDRARRLAEEADARLAAAIAESNQARQSLQQVQDGIAALKQQLQRKNP